MDIINLDAHSDCIITNKKENIIIVTYPKEIARGNLVRYHGRMFEVMAADPIGKHWRIRVRIMGHVK